MQTIEAAGGETAEAFCARLWREARRLGQRVDGDFNGRKLVAEPRMSQADIYEQWDVDWRRSYFGKSAKFRTLDN